MCGIIGVANVPVAAAEIITAQELIQHRGQDGTGISTATRKGLFTYKGIGLVTEVFRDFDYTILPGDYGIGENRYPTVGAIKNLAQNLKPRYLKLPNYPYEVSLAHNGQVINLDELVEFSEDRGWYWDPVITVDAEHLLRTFALYLLDVAKGRPIEDEHIYDATDMTLDRVKGAYSTVALVRERSGKVWSIAFRSDPAIRPFVWGEKRTNNGTGYMFASETAPLDNLGYSFLGDLDPGEVLIVEDGEVRGSKLRPDGVKAPCVFEHIYFSRPDNRSDGVSASKYRGRLGIRLADGGIPDVDVFGPVPSSGQSHADGLAHVLIPQGVRQAQVLSKHPYSVMRTFIMPKDAERKRGVKAKIGPNAGEVKGQRALLVDDSIVRGNTSEALLVITREAGATEASLGASCAPIYPCVYGIDHADPDELLIGRFWRKVRKEMPDASREERHAEVCKRVGEKIGAKWFYYNPPWVLDEEYRRLSGGVSPCRGCFTGEYPTKEAQELVNNAKAGKRIYEDDGSGEA